MFIKENIDMFAWSAYKALGVDLNVNPSFISRKQPYQCSSKEYSDTVKDEVIKLKQAGAIKEVFYPEWLTNIVW